MKMSTMPMLQHSKLPGTGKTAAFMLQCGLARFDASDDMCYRGELSCRVTELYWINLTSHPSFSCHMLARYIKTD